MSSNPMLKGTLQTIILKLLENNSQMYGYEITQKVKDVTTGEILLTEGALYPALHKLEADGLLEGGDVLSLTESGSQEIGDADYPSPGPVW